MSLNLNSDKIAHFECSDLSISLSIYIYCLNPVERTFVRCAEASRQEKRKNKKKDRKRRIGKVFTLS